MVRFLGLKENHPVRRLLEARGVWEIPKHDATTIPARSDKPKIIGGLIAVRKKYDAELSVCEQCKHVVRSKGRFDTKVPWVLFAKCAKLDESCSCAQMPLRLAQLGKRCPEGYWEKSDESKMGGDGGPTGGDAAK